MFKHCGVNSNRFADSVKFVCKAIKVQSRVCNCCYNARVASVRLYATLLERGLESRAGYQLRMM